MKTSERINYIKNWVLDSCKSMPKEPETPITNDCALLGILST